MPHRPTGQHRRNRQGVLFPLTAAIGRVYGIRPEDGAYPLAPFYNQNVSNKMWRRAGGVWYTPVDPESVTSRKLRDEVVEAFAASIITGAEVVLPSGVVVDWEQVPANEASGLPPANVSTSAPHGAGSAILATVADVEEQLQAGIAASSGLSDEVLWARLLAAKTRPRRVEVSTHAYVRNPDVVVFVLRRASGVCEQCNQGAPFFRLTDGTPYLEVHHRVRLSQGGADSVENAIAVCPNCHRSYHYGGAA